MGKADLHLHTSVSDGMYSVARLLEHVEHTLDLDVIAVTDHEDAAGGQRARELAAQRGYRVEVIVGAEVTTRHGHLLALNIETAPKSFRSVEATLEAIHEQGGIAVIPHPFSWLTRSLSERTVARILHRDEPGITFDAIELANPSPAGRATAARAARHNRAWRLPVTGSSSSLPVTRRSPGTEGCSSPPSSAGFFSPTRASRGPRASRRPSSRRPSSCPSASPRPRTWPGSRNP